MEDEFVIRAATYTDLSQVYELTRDLMLLHENAQQIYTMNYQLMMTYFKQGYFTAKVLVKKSALNNDNNVVLGALLYNENYYYNGAHGIYLEVFYISKHLRGQGLGKFMLKSLFKEVLLNRKAFIRLMHNQNMNVFVFYEKFGFVNDKDMEYFEKEEDNLFKSLEIELEKHQTECSEVLVETKVLRETISSPLISYSVKHKEKELSFYLQVNFCSWRGPVLLLTNLTGSSELLAHPMLFKIIHSFIETHDNLKIARDLWIDIKANQLELRHFLENNNFINVCDDGWCRAMINSSAMKHYLEH